MSKEYINYLEAKVDELEKQVRLCMNLSYYKDARIRTLNAKIIDLEVKFREDISRCDGSCRNPFSDSQSS